MSSLRRHWTMLSPIAFGLASLVGFVVIGIPFERNAAFAWLLVGLLCFSVTDLRGYLRGLIFDWLPLIAILLAYDSLRATAGRLEAVRYLPQIHADRTLFGGQVPTVTLQRWLWHGHVSWYDVLCWAVYLTHFLFTPVLAAVLWRIDRKRFKSFTRLVIALSFAGLATYALYPAAPPWLASQKHLIAPITRIIPQVWSALPIHGAGSVVESGYQLANNVAAVPSLHAAFSLLIAITVWPQRRRWLRPLVAAYPLAMAFSVVYTGEHYVTDVLLGWIYTAVIVVAARAMARRRVEHPATVPAVRPSPEPA
ncbi:MAG TPA: phosphatase PAP2 family protein [Solirubrobacteraceae bacterium]|nr:phosphatase PAP2 family protein [Solirubrobacteraceae bacterium]